MLNKAALLLSENAVTVENRTNFEIDVQSISKLVDFLKGELGVDEATSVDVTFVDEDVMAALHVRYMGLPGSTDVLSFPTQGGMVGRPRGHSFLRGCFCASLIRGVKEQRPSEALGAVSFSRKPAIVFEILWSAILRKVFQPLAPVSGEVLGDIVVCPGVVADSKDKSVLQGRIPDLIIHGLLHLCGYDHSTFTSCSYMRVVGRCLKFQAKKGGVLV